MTEVLIATAILRRVTATGIVVVGQVARDLVLVVDEVPGAGGRVDVRRRREMLGGKGANIDERAATVSGRAVAAARGGLDLDQLARTESLFALSNGHLGVRGNLDEGEPTTCPAPT